MLTFLFHVFYVMTKTEKKERKEKIKNILLRTLHIISYILSICFIGLCVFASCQSCQKKSSVIAESETPKINNLLNYNGQNYYVYDLKTFDSNPIEISFSTQTLFDYTEHIDTSIHYQSQQSSYQINVPNLDGYVERNGNLVYFSSISLKYRCMPYYDNEELQYYSYRLQYIYFLLNWGYPDTNDFETYYLVNWFGNDQVANYNDYNFNNGGDLHVVINPSSIDYYFFNYFFEPCESFDFTFNNPFNYNAPYNFPNTTSFFPYTSNADILFTTYDLPYFVSNGRLFNRIELVYYPGNITYFVDKSNNKVVRGTSGNWFFYKMRYINTDNSYSVDICTRNTEAMTDSNDSWVYVTVDSLTWLNSSFRKITFLSPLTDQQTLNITALNNNYNSSFNGDIGGLADAFDLLAFAFNSLIPFLSVMILPGISIGTLFFLPLIVGIVMTVLYLVKR